VPVLDEESLIAEFLCHVRSIAPKAEIIVVDGGSHDATVIIATAYADRVLSAPTGRGLQMNAGARVARGEVFWFLHADLRLPLAAPRMIEAALLDTECAGGCFRLRFPNRETIYRVSDSLGNVGVEIFGFALGDHGIFCRRESFWKMGGYPAVPILEDAEIYRRLHRIGKMMQLPSEIVCSPRTYEKYGPYRTTAVYFLILVLYFLRVPIEHLNRIYCRFRAARITNSATIEWRPYLPRSKRMAQLR
jgi:rSAM/selenodomain-associated transferase 2